MKNNKIVSDFYPADIKTPVAFNPFKHHLSCLKAAADEWRKLHWSEVEKNLLLIGSNVTDLYYGSLSVEEICSEFVQFAKENNLNSPERLVEWLLPYGYRKVTLADNSVWVVRQGVNPDRFLHIHPAKYSPYTIRVRGTTLKTVAGLYLSGTDIQHESLLESVNRVRTEKLDLSPVKSLQKGRGILKILDMFYSESND